ncbi:MAG TPA: SDR family oxidoreductase [Mycobacteriales bacterium]|nr:SDR family oxidoreductase [Mycobacteriales bacterium]
MADARPMALVTGASSGIGLELARVLAREGHDVALVARREPELTALADELRDAHGVAAHVITADLSEPAAPEAVVKALTEAGRDVDILVNNAGFGGHGRFAETDAGHERRMIAVNVAALTELTKLLVPGMVARGRGRVLNVASTAAFQPGPFMAVYYATKAYVLSFSEALSEELSGSGVTVTALCPGAVPSGFQDAAGWSEDLPLRHAPGQKSARQVAEAAYAGMMRGRRIVVPGTLNKVGVQAVRLSPRRVVTSVVRRLHPPD